MDRGVNPMIHRVAASDHYTDRLIDIQREWSLLDLTHALIWLDAIDEASEPDDTK